MLLFPPSTQHTPTTGGRGNLSFSTLTIFCHHLLHPVPPSTQHTPTTWGEGELIFQHAYYILSSLTTSCSPFHTTYLHRRGGGGYHDHWGGLEGLAHIYLYDLLSRNIR